MKLNQKLIQISLLSNKFGGYTLDLKMKNITTVMNVNDFVKCSDIQSLILSYNYLKTLEDIMIEFTNLNFFDMSVNHLKEIKNLEAFRKLEYLNLSTNRISKIENLHKLKSLIHLDLSMNYIEKIENLTVPFLKKLILSGNQIKYLENLEHLQYLEHLDISKNKIEELGCLGLPPQYKHLKTFVCSSNLLGISYLDELIYTAQNLPNIEELDFVGNDLTTNKQYKYKFLYFKSLLRLDGIEIKGILRNHLETMKNTNEYDNLVERSKEEALEKLRSDQLLKKQLKSLTYEKEKEIDFLYEKYENNMKEDLNEFIEFMSDYQKRRNKGEAVELNENILNRWKNKIILAEKERERIKEKNDETFDQVQKVYLDSKLTIIPTEKSAFYKPNMKVPNYWVDEKIKSVIVKNNDNYEQIREQPIIKMSVLNKQDFYINKSTNSNVNRNEENEFEDLGEKKQISSDNIKRQSKIRSNTSIAQSKIKNIIDIEVLSQKFFPSNPDIALENSDLLIPIEKQNQEASEWENILLEQDIEENNKNEVQNQNNSFQSDNSIRAKKKINLKIDTFKKQVDSPKNKKNVVKKIEDSRKNKNDFLKDEKLKGKLDKLTKSILEKDSSVDSHSISRNTLLRNDVDWKAKRKEFLEKLKVKKTEDEMIRKSILNEENLDLEKKKKGKSRKCNIF